MEYTLFLKAEGTVFPLRVELESEPHIAATGSDDNIENLGAGVFVKRGDLVAAIRSDKVLSRRSGPRRT
jgi:hypothetical protein